MLSTISLLVGSGAFSFLVDFFLQINKHRLYLDHDIISILRHMKKNQEKFKYSFNILKIL